jgi:tetratricopeptide (TPR) repeat protein
MRFLTGLILVVLLILPAAAWAQEATPEATLDVTPTPATLNEANDRLTEAVAQAERAAEDARNYADDARLYSDDAIARASGLMDLFQNVIQTIFGIFGIITPILAIAAGVLGFSRLNNASNELKEAKEQFEKDVQVKQAELLAVRQELEASARQQRDSAAKANLALSLLPLGERQYQAGDYQGAIDTYKRALELDPDSVVTQYRLGYVYTQSGMLDEAKAQLDKALAREPEFAPALAALGYVTRRVAEKMPDSPEKNISFTDAERLLLRALTISPKLIDEDGEAWWGSLGGLYRRRGQNQQAIFAYNKAAEATPHSSYAHGNLALLYSQTGNVEAMLETYKRVEQLAWGEVQGNIDNYWGYADLLAARLALGKEEKAEEALISVLRTVPPESPEAFKMLLDTLGRLQQVLGPDRGAHIGSFMDRIAAADEARKRTPAST